MAKQPFKDSTVLAGNASECIDLSGYSNAFGFTRGVGEIDTTTFADLCRRRIGALKDGSFSCSVFDDDGGQPWDTLNDLFGTAACHYGWVESNASMAEGDYGWFLRALQSTYERGGSTGEAVMMNISGNGDGPVLMGRVLQQDESLASTGNSTGIQFGSLAAGETLHCVHWVQSVTGTITSTIESDDNSGFTSATTQATFTAATGATCEEQTVSGAVTDDWWRYEYTIVTGPAVVVCMIGKV